MEIDVWDPAEPRTLANVRDGIVANTTYTDLFCSMQVQDPHRRATMTVGGDDGLGGNAPNDAAIGVTSYTNEPGMQNEAPMNYPALVPHRHDHARRLHRRAGRQPQGRPRRPRRADPRDLHPRRGLAAGSCSTGATSAAAYGDGGADHAGADENRWWYPRAFVAPGQRQRSSTSPAPRCTSSTRPPTAAPAQITLRGTLPADVANQGALGNPVGATSTADHVPPRQDPAGRRRLVGQRRRPRRRPRRPSPSTSPAAPPTRSSPRPRR